MKDVTHENGLDTLNATIAELRAEIAALGPSLKKLMEQKIDADVDDRDHRQKSSGSDDIGRGGWASIRHGISEVGSRGGKLAGGLAEEVERHPLISAIAAFSLGFLFAKLLFRRS
jgi:hypothetical protein